MENEGCERMSGSQPCEACRQGYRLTGMSFNMSKTPDAEPGKWENHSQIC